jgi:Uncharacterised protein family (UPF0236)
VPAYQPRIAALVAEVLSQFARRLAEVEDLAQLEHLVRELGLRIARGVAEVVLEGLDQLLSQQRPAGWRVKDVRPRTLESTVGTLHLKRRRYRDAEGSWRYPLDEALKLAPQAQVTPELQRLMVEVSSQLPFEAASRLLHELMPTAPARSTLHRHLGRVGEACHQADERQRQEVFVAGKVPAGKRKVPVLLVEADGKWVRLQRTPGQRSLEVKLALAYEGWEREGLKRWRLRDKQVYVSTGDAPEVWEGLSARLARHYDLSRTRVAVAGDAAGWVKQGREHFQDAIWQLDRFHLARPLHRVLTVEEATAAYRAACQGDLESVLAALRRSPHPKAGEVASYLTNQSEGLLDYRRREGFADLRLRGLGATEGNIDKVLATRMGKRGMAWTPAGARRMGKVLEAWRNDELAHHLTAAARQRGRDAAEPAIRPLRRQAATAITRSDPQAWLRASIGSLPSSDGFGPLLRRIARPAGFAVN